MPGTANRTGTGAHRAAGAPGRINLRSEWTLMVFSFLAALLVGRYASALIEPSESPFAPAGPIHPLLMPLLGAGAMVLSTLHLGRRRRAWRSVLNWRRSWLSREVMLFPAFLAVASASVVLQPSGPGGVAGWVAAALGFAALFAVDSVYHVTSVPGLRIHSARVFSTGLLFSGLFSANVLLFGLVAAVKAFLYLWRKYSFYGEHRDVRPWFTRVRVLIGLLAPLVLWWLGEPRWYPLLVVAVIAGELIDRAEFYIELEAPSPARQMYADLAAIFQKKG
jgi:DMSO reductase anchor subunit